MHLSSFGLISLKGSVTKPEPGLGFADYQVAMANYSASLILRARVQKALESDASPDTPEDGTVQQNCETKPLEAANKPKKRAPLVDGMSLVRKFRG